ncbi:MAG: hypothetical protein J3K34DRAFT_243985 [Monoraphidium minutum]|nr:MAG: hypothetical protein J3K34DRAFT_243985 [Monoraphidium minutum]
MAPAAARTPAARTFPLAVRSFAPWPMQVGPCRPRSLLFPGAAPARCPLTNCTRGRPLPAPKTLIAACPAHVPAAPEPPAGPALHCQSPALPALALRCQGPPRAPVCSRHGPPEQGALKYTPTCSPAPLPTPCVAPWAPPPGAAAGARTRRPRRAAPGRRPHVPSPLLFAPPPPAFRTASAPRLCCRPPPPSSPFLQSTGPPLPRARPPARGAARQAPLQMHSVPTCNPCTLQPPPARGGRPPPLPGGREERTGGVGRRQLKNKVLCKEVCTNVLHCV